MDRNITYDRIQERKLLQKQSKVKAESKTLKEETIYDGRWQHKFVKGLWLDMRKMK